MSNYDSPPPQQPPPGGGSQQPGYGSVPSGPQLAPWIQRVGAYLLDYVLYVPFLIVANIAMPNSTSSTSTSDGNMVLAVLMYLIVAAIFIYNRCYLGGQGQSFGKKTLNLVLVAEATGQPIGTGKAFLRDVCHILDSLACYVGWLFPLWDKKRQTFADKIMTTVVPVKA